MFCKETFNCCKDPVEICQKLIISASESKTEL